MEIFTDEFFMKEALKEAEKALEKEEVPIGAVIVGKNRIIARGHNLTETLNDATAHAEMQTITSATSYIGGKYLTDLTLYVTLEPCVMCMGALFWSKISKIVYGASDQKQGFSKYNNILTKNGLSLLHPKTEINGGTLENECSKILKYFFEKKRK
jgi:tRNA(adenine34) deaminase